MLSVAATQCVAELPLGSNALLAERGAMEERQEASRHRPDGLRRDEAVADEQLGQLTGVPRVQPSTKPPLGDLEEGVTMDKRAQVHTPPSQAGSCGRTYPPRKTARASHTPSRGARAEGDWVRFSVIICGMFGVAEVLNSEFVRAVTPS